MDCSCQFKLVVLSFLFLFPHFASPIFAGHSSYENTYDGCENGFVLPSDSYTMELEAPGNPCNLNLETHVYLEGALLDPQSSGEYLQDMRTDLNSSRVLPGQSYSSFLFGLNYTEPGQPYYPEPWNYFGNEGDGFDSQGSLDLSSAGYASTVVDWVLVTLRPGSSPESPAVWRTAGLLHKDGSVELLRSLPCCALDEGSSYYLMIQHRNHMPVMSHQALEFVDGTLTYDFRSQDSYIFDVFGFGAVGQKEVESGVYAMFAGNGDQTIANQSEIEINFNDKQRFDEDLGIQQQYSIGDYNLDGNVQFNDKLVLIENLGSQSSVSPVGSVVTSEVGLDCGSVQLIGELIEEEEAEDAWIELSYTSGCGEYGGQEIPSSGVEGLIATLESGTFEEEGVLVLTISGTPDSGGTAEFLLEIAGESCILEVKVEFLEPVYPPGTVHCDPDNPTEVVEVTNPATGRIWMDRNLGAPQVASSSTDSLAYGDLYQWGRGADGHQCRDSETTDDLSNSDQPGHGDFITSNSGANWDWRSPQNPDLWQGVNGVNNPCPSDYRLPTKAELEVERQSWSSNDAAGAFDSPLKLALTGGRFGSGSFYAFGVGGIYWSSTVSGTSAHDLVFSNDNAGLSFYNRAAGAAVRCIKDVLPPQGSIDSLHCKSPTLTGTIMEGQEADGVSIEIPYTGGNGGFHDGQTVNSTDVEGLTATLEAGSFETGSGNLTYEITGTPDTLGLASFAVEIGGQNCTIEIEVEEGFPCISPTEVVEVINPQTGQTWMDRNLGAGQAATSSTDEHAYGDLYQWGRDEDGHQCRSSEATSTQATTAEPMGGNAWDGKFIYSHNNWLNVNNHDLWQGVNGENNPCPTGYRIPTEAEFNDERQSWSSNDAAGALDSPLKLPMGGSRHFTSGLISQVGNWGIYWTSTAFTDHRSRNLQFSSSSTSLVLRNRAYGYSVRCIKDESSVQGFIEVLDCESATHTGILTEGEEADGVNAEIPYEGGNGGPHDGQSVSSTGVAGLTATLEAGSFETGSGTLTYEITGTPDSAGTASFAIEIGGETCILEVAVEEAGTSADYPAGTVHCDPDNPTEVVDIINPVTTRVWMDRNLGASQVATSSTDSMAYGDLYQWGRGADGHQCRLSGTTNELSSTDQPGHGEFILAPNFPRDWRSPQNNNLWQGTNGINNPCPSGYRVPTSAEFHAERDSWNSTDAAGAFSSPLKLPRAGLRGGFSGAIVDVGLEGYYWSSNPGGINATRLDFDDNWAGIGNVTRRGGHSVRCIKEGTIESLDCGSATHTGTLREGEDASSVTSEIPYTGGVSGSYDGQTIHSSGVTGLTAELDAGNFLNGAGTFIYTITGTPDSFGTASFALEIGEGSCTLEITVNEAVPCGITTEVVDVTNPQTGKTWMDRNLGASQVATSSIDPDAYGGLYQWGRGADGHQCRLSETTDELSSTDQPGHGDFILIYSSPFNWRNPQNNNLWQGVNGLNNPCPSGYRVPTEAEWEAESDGWSSSSDAFDSPLKLPMAGSRHRTSGLVQWVGDSGYYWSSTIQLSSSYGIFFDENWAFPLTLNRGFGLSVRCIKD